ncbi:iron-hydroxamate ABC transporter substrate-binding protein [Alkalihalobacillus macyae]|uniref:iron-hydroxamate ABC transporter substrate-binding protein n=1 Tax=Guptibacillus hwajinpoensis TaxID=208199 RepID=UPI00273B0B97|nr:iron-hydroxamate ABC transporter substrate-binding protein [Alkalihalobacillus macyae]MDP4549496.1 iron-hydroxamate ABC transporter substrate-binding protein [Alkalihalobacillus macyae]
MKKNRMKTPLILLFMFVLILGACANEESNGESKSDQNDSGSEMKTFTLPDGQEFEIPTNPERIVATDYVGYFLALGITPVGAPDQFVLDNPYLAEEQIKNIEDIGSPPSVEKVTSLNPDLIVVTDQEQYDLLSKIAPTVLMPFGAYDSLDEEVTAMGEIAGKKAEAKEWIEQFDEKAAAAREELDGVIGEDETVGIYEVQTKDFYVFGDNFGRGGQVIYDALQLKAPEKIQKEVIDGDNWKQISLEVLPEYAADHMFYTEYAAEDNQDVLKETKESALWQNLEAVKNDQLYEMKFENMYYYDPIAVEGQLDLIVDKLKGK